MCGIEKRGDALVQAKTAELGPRNMRATARIRGGRFPPHPPTLLLQLGGDDMDNIPDVLRIPLAVILTIAVVWIIARIIVTAWLIAPGKFDE